MERIWNLLGEMGNPQRGCKFIHIAGTNGKGSVSHIIADILRQAGYRVGRFTSPHLHSYRERFAINGDQITEPAMEAILDGIEAHIQTMVQRGEEHPTEFEVLTALAFQYFRDAKVDLAVLEVGMGGIYDSTNVITPVVSVITGIDFDHTAFLGTTLAEIAANKAGIIKPGVPVVIGLMGEEAKQVIQEQARLLGAPLCAGSEIRIIPVEKPNLDHQLVNIDGCGLSVDRVDYSLPGVYQLRNLAVALRTLMLLNEQGYDINDRIIRASLAKLKMPGRLEIVHTSPLVIVDAAHNSQGAAALVESLDILLPGQKRVLVVGMLDDKERDSVVKALGRNTRAAIVTRPAGARSQAWQEVAQQLRLHYPGIEMKSIEDIATAVNTGLGMVRGDEYVLITGSFYVLDQARRLFI